MGPVIKVEIIMKKFILTHALFVILIAFFNLLSGLGFEFENETFLILWWFFYTVVLPISLSKRVYDKYKGKGSFLRVLLAITLVYFLGVLISFAALVDFTQFKFRGDRITNLFLIWILNFCLGSSVFGFILFSIKNIFYKK